MEGLGVDADMPMTSNLLDHSFQPQGFGSARVTSEVEDLPVALWVSAKSYLEQAGAFVLYDYLGHLDFCARHPAA